MSFANSAMFLAFAALETLRTMWRNGAVLDWMQSIHYRLKRRLAV